jgi:transposase
MSYSVDLRTRTLDFIERGGSKAEASKLFKVSLKSVFNWVRQKKTHGNLEAKKRRLGAYKIDEQRLRSHIEHHPDDYLREIAFALGFSTSGVKSALKRLKISYKKNSTLQRERRKLEKRVSKKSSSY